MNPGHAGEEHDETLKTWLCRTNTAKLLYRKCEAGFWVIFLGRKPQTSMIPNPNIQLLLHCMIHQDTRECVVQPSTASAGVQ